MRDIWILFYDNIFKRFPNQRHAWSVKVPSTCLFNLLLSLETPSPDPLNIGELVKEEKPLKAIDFCYHDEDEMVDVLDCISLCVMVIAYAPDSIRGQQMLVSDLANSTYR
jgi:hypothetical protein